MKFLRIILIGSLALSPVMPVHGISLQPLINWWQSRPTYEKIAWGYILICAALACYKIKKDWNKVYYSENREAVSAILRAPIEVDDPQAQQEREIKQLQDLIATGYRFTTDRYFDTYDNYDLKASSIGFLMRAINRKPYLIPLLKELGATPMLINALDDNKNPIDPLVYCFERAAQKNSPDAFNTLLESYPLSEAQWDHLIKRTSTEENRWCAPMMLANIIPHMPAQLVNNAYHFYSHLQYNWTLLFLCATKSLNAHESHRHYAPLIKQLLDKGADPLIPDNVAGKTTLDLLSPHIDDNPVTREIKKRLKDIVKPYVESKKKEHAEAIDDAVSRILPTPIINLCSDYEYDTGSELLLELINSNDTEEEIRKKISCVTQQHKEVFGKDITGATPLMYAAARGHAQVAQDLMDHGADIEVCDREEQNAITHAAYRGHHHVIKVILEQAKKDKKSIPTLINKQDDTGNTPLIRSMASRQTLSKAKEATVRLLLEYNADTTHALSCTSNIAGKAVRNRIEEMLKNPPRPAAQPTQSLSLAAID